MEMGLDWNGEAEQTKAKDPKIGKLVIQISPELYCQAGVDLLLGSPEKAKSKLGWRQAVSFEQLVRIMAEAELTRARVFR